MKTSADYLLGLTDDPTPSAYLSAVSDEDQVQVNVRELESAAGHGAVVDSERVMGQVAFRRTWMRSHGLSADQCSVIKVVGESMEPTLPDDCSILVNHAQRDLRRDRIFVLRTKAGLIVKRVNRNKNGWRLESDHPAWEPIPWPDGAQIVGEVKWCAKTL